MNRRTFLCGLTLGTLAAPLAAAAQQPGKTARVGVLASTPRETSTIVMPTIITQLREMGYVEGENLFIEHRHTRDQERYSQLAAELVALKVDVIFASNPYFLRASREATATIPIVGYDLESDPVLEGFAATLARPGGNVTGIFLDQPELSAKQLQLLREVVPRLGRVVVLWDSPLAQLQFRAVEGAARKLDITVHSIVWRGERELSDGLRRATRDGARGLIVLSSPRINTIPNRRLIADAALRSRLPSISLFPTFTEVGGLMAYGPSERDLYRSAGTLVGKILGGARPGELPIERPARFEFVINAQTARALVLTIPQTLLQRADEVIQ